MQNNSPAIELEVIENPPKKARREHVVGTTPKGLEKRKAESISGSPGVTPVPKAGRHDSRDLHVELEKIRAHNSEQVGANAGSSSSSSHQMARAAAGPATHQCVELLLWWTDESLVRVTLPMNPQSI